MDTDLAQKNLRFEKILFHYAIIVERIHMLNAQEEFDYELKKILWYDFYSSWAMPDWSFIPGEQLQYQNQMLGVYL